MQIVNAIMFTIVYRFYFSNVASYLIVNKKYAIFESFVGE